MQSIKLKLTGIGAGLLMHSDAGLDPLHPIQREIKKITSRGTKNRTEDDIAELQRLEFVMGLYYSDEIGPYLPAAVIEAGIRDGAKARKLGKETTRSILISTDRVPLEYEGPRDLKGLWRAKFYDTRSVKVGQSRVLRTRPHFAEWSATFDLMYDAEHIDRDVALWCVQNAGARIGLGDYRPRFGRFEVEELE